VSLEFPENKATASRYVREAIPMMVKNNIPPNPCNFALWYAYVSNRDFELKIALDDTLAKEGTCPPGVSKDLFRKHVIGDELAQQANLEDSLANIMADLMGDVESTYSGTDAFCNNLEENLETLVNDQDPEHVKQAVQSMIDVTKDTNEIIGGFQNQLKSAEMEIHALKAQLEQKEKDASIDALTQIGNRRAFDQRLYELCENTPAQTTLILIDLDYFKKLNDTYGHLLGDKVLQGVAEILKKVCPKNALAARYGGEEFALLLEDNQEGGFALAEKVRQLLCSLSLRKKNSDQVIDNITASFGVAQQLSGEMPEQLIERADKALYSAKDNGRDQVVKAA
jgi:diguanylate cyclase